MRASSLKTRYAFSAAAYAGSQGSIFLAFSWLMLNGETAHLGRVGLGLGYLVLAMGISDWGGLSLLGKRFLLGTLRHDLAEIDRARLVASGSVTCGVAVFGLASTDAFVSGMLLGGTLATLVWGLNLTGAVEAMHRARWARLAQGLPFVFTAAAIFGVPANPNMMVWGLKIGGAFSLGACVAVAIQRYSSNVTLNAHAQDDTRFASESYAKSGAWSIFSFLPGQAYGAACLLVVVSVLGYEIAGIFVYARAVVVFATQVVTIGSRVYSERLVVLFKGPRSSLVMIFEQFKEMLIVSWMLSLLIWLACWAVGQTPIGTTITATVHWTAMFAVAIPITALGMLTFQACVMAGRDAAYSIVNFFSVIFAFAIFMLALNVLGLAAFLAGELAQNLIRLGWASRALANETNSRAGT